MPPENFRGGNHASSTVEQFGVENAQSKMGHLSTLHEVSVRQGAIFQGLCCAAAEGRAYLQFVFFVMPAKFLYIYQKNVILSNQQ